MSDTPVPALVTLHLWTVASRHVPHALLRMGLDRAAVRRLPGVRFAKMLGTGDGRTFTARDATPHRWGLLTTWASLEQARRFPQTPTARAWQALATEQLRLDLRPLLSRGLWSGRRPFGDPEPARGSGPVAAVTRARLRLRTAPRFWASVPEVSRSLHDSPGLRAAVGIGEAPLGLQGTFSLWDDDRSLREFASRGAAHAEVVRRTPAEGWYAEELFARFAVLDALGTLDGREVL